MAFFFVVIFVLLYCTSGSPVHSNRGLTADIGDAGVEYKENEVYPNKRTELFEVPAQPALDDSNTVNDFKQESISSSQKVEDSQEKNSKCRCSSYKPHCCPPPDWGKTDGQLAGDYKAGIAEESTKE